MFDLKHLFDLFANAYNAGQIGGISTRLSRSRTWHLAKMRRRLGGYEVWNEVRKTAFRSIPLSQVPHFQQAARSGAADHQALLMWLFYQSFPFNSNSIDFKQRLVPKKPFAPILALQHVKIGGLNANYCFTKALKNTRTKLIFPCNRTWRRHKSLVLALPF